MSIEKSLKIISWNIQSRDGPTGNKLNDKSCVDTLTSADIFCLQECRKNIKVPKCICYNNLRPSSSGGGVTIGFSRRLLGGIKRFDTGNKIDILAIVLDKTFFRRKRNVLLITCYIPPSNSSYLKKHDRDPFNDLTTLLEEVEGQYEIILCGDFNSRCQSLNESNLCTEIPGILTGNEIDDQHNGLLDRNNKDKSTNSYTNTFMDLVTQSNLSIRNGRSLGDIFGEFTHVGYNGASTVDYFLASSTISTTSTILRVFKLTEFSDHKPLILCWRTPKLITPDIVPPKQDDAPQQYCWTDESKEDFLLAQENKSIQTQIKELSSKDIGDHNELINLNSKTINILHQIADASLQKKKINPRNKFKNKNKWFDKDCRNAKRVLNASLRLLNRNDRDVSARIGYYTARKEYRAMLNRKKHCFNSDLNKNIETLNKKNINWSTLNKMRSLKQEIIPFDEFDLECFYKFFQNLYSLSTSLSPNNRSSLLHNSSIENEQLLKNMTSSLVALNKDITLNELDDCRKHLSNGKSVSLDLISNEMLKNLDIGMRQLLVKLFNVCLQQGVYPWNVSTITPIHKSGDPYDPDNYRAIALGSCIGKLFSSIILSRIHNFRTDCYPDPPNQLGFKKGAQTADHVFTLKTIIDSNTDRPSKKLYTCFVDFRKAFDSVAREALLYKIAKLGIGGNVFNTLKNMYENTSTRIKLINKLSDYIKLNNGVEQGHPLSPELFKIFIYDLSIDLNKITKGVPNLNKTLVNHLFWADDLVLLALDEGTPQELVNVLSKYCHEWGLTINLRKTKIIIFNKSGRTLATKNPIILDGKPIESTSSYCYLGIVFVPSGKFKVAISELKKKALRAFFKLRSIVSRHNLTPNSLFKLFDALIAPILTYGSQVFFPETKFSELITNKCKTNKDSWKLHWLSKVATDPFESLHLSFIKWVLGTHRKTTNLACWTETGRLPLGIKVAKQYYKFCLRGTDAHEQSLLFHTVEEQKLKNMKWYAKFQQMNNSFSSRPATPLDYLPSPITILNSGLITMFKAIWDGALIQSKKLTLLKSLKQDWGPEPYINLLPLNLRQNLTRLRTSAHSLPIETGRYERPVIPRDQRFCKVCSKAGYPKLIGDEKHLLFQCVIGRQKRLTLQGELKNAIFSQDIAALFDLEGNSLVRLGMYLNEVYSSYTKTSQ